MSSIVVNKKDELIMALVHYFITVKDYTPIVVRGVKDEIWLENTNEAYKIIRINSNHIHNDEQLEFDFYKVKSIVRQIKRKTFSFSVNTLNIFTDLGDNVNLKNTKNIDNTFLDSFDGLKKSGLSEMFPDIAKKIVKDKEGLDFIINVTSDLNKKTEASNKVYEQTFKPKRIIVTKVIILTCVLMYLVCCFLDKNFMEFDVNTLYKIGANSSFGLQNYEFYRLISYMFLHGGIIHLFVNMYSLSIIGNLIETYFGKLKMIIIYLFSGIGAGLLSAVIHENVVSIGASGAIFGLLGSLLYFGYHYRVFLGEALQKSIIPIIIINLFIGFVIPGIDVYAHIGGLICGYLITMAVGVTGKSSKTERTNGIICCIALIAFLLYLLLFR